jgi:hypothetical protein
MKRLVALVCVALLCGTTFAQRSAATGPPTSGQQALAYSLDHRVGLAHAVTAIGADFLDVSQELGFPGSFGLFDALMDASLLQATCWSLKPRLAGTAAGTVGLSESRLAALFRLRMANDASFLPECPSTNPGEQPYLWFVVRVWTVGDSYPVAYHFDVTGNIFPDYPDRPTDPVEAQWLGYAHASQIEDQLRHAWTEAVEDFALRYLHISRYR